jgi:hypothetical protein
MTLKELCRIAEGDEIAGMQTLRGRLIPRNHSSLS